tara:strand:+ start:1293 stop:1466 length:174 start_codon:yes stop_codon:yes gene_type:complete
MIGRNKNWIGPSDWIKEFNKKHNPGIFYGKEKKKTTHKKETDRPESTKRNPVFKVSD